MKAPESAKTNKYFLITGDSALAFAVRESWIGLYGNSQGAINLYNTDGTLFSGTVPGSELPNVVGQIESFLGQSFDTSEIILVEGNIEDLNNYTILEP